VSCSQEEVCDLERERERETPWVQEQKGGAEFKRWFTFVQAWIEVHWVSNLHLETCSCPYTITLSCDTWESNRDFVFHIYSELQSHSNYLY